MHLKATACVWNAPSLRANEISQEPRVVKVIRKLLGTLVYFNGSTCAHIYFWLDKHEWRSGIFSHTHTHTRTHAHTHTQTLVRTYLLRYRSNNIQNLAISLLTPLLVVGCWSNLPQPEHQQWGCRHACLSNVHSYKWFAFPKWLCHHYWNASCRSSGHNCGKYPNVRRFSIIFRHMYMCMFLCAGVIVAVAPVIANICINF